MRYRTGLVSSSVVALLVAAAPVTAQQETEAPAGAIQETVDVEVVNVDVQVVDRQGMPVSGLDLSNFQVFENGERVEPVNFYEVVREDPDANAPIWLVLYFDQHNMLSANRDRALAELEVDLPAVLEDRRVRVMVAAHDQKPEVIQDFTRNFGAIRGALASLKGQETVGDARDGLRQSAQLSVTDIFQRMRSRDRLDRQNAGLAIDALLGEMRTYAREVHADSLETFDALGNFVRTLAWLEGRKALVFVSDGVAERPVGTLMEHIQDLLTGGASDAGALVERAGGGQAPGTPGTGGLFDRDASMEVGRLQQEVEQYRATATIQAIVAEANTYGVTLVAAKPPPGDAATSARRSRGRGSLIEIADRREALHSLADGTGGVARTGGGRLTGLLTRAVGGMQSYYSLGLSSADKFEGEFTSIEVRVRGVRGATANYRQSYVKKGVRSRISERALAAAFVGQSDNQHRMEVSVDAMMPVEGEDLFDVQMWIEFPINSVELVEVDGIHRSATRLVVVAMDDEDELTAAQHLEVPLQVPGEALAEALESHYRAGLRIRLPPGRQRIALGLWDQVARSGSVLTDALTVGTPQ
ncbi:MAG: VWA domain-containing protein [Acidobacteria bacterium]|nr:VWA domain-containing protein [Acidobacteriota bacterium]